MPEVPRIPRVAIVGGGMAGLAAARVLEDARLEAGDIDWVLFEQEARFGGKVHTVRRDGFVVEGGPDSAIVEKPWPIQMAHRLGIGDRLLDSNEDVRRSFVYAGGRLHELPEGIILMVPTRLVPFALSGLLSWPGKLRMALDLALPRGGAARGATRGGRTSWAATRGADTPGGGAAAGGVSGVAAATPDESLAAFVRRRLGREALDRIAEPIVAGIHAGDPEQMSVQATFPMFLQMEREHRSLIVAMLKRRRARARAAAGRALRATARSSGTTPAGTTPADATIPRSYFYSFRTGLADLSDAMVASLPAERLRGGEPVRSLACAAPARHAGTEGGGYVLELAGGQRERADAVVLAPPAWASAELLRAVVPSAAADLASIPYVTTATVSLAFRRDQVHHPLRGFGYVVPRAEGRGVMATTWSSSKFPHRAPEGHVLLRSFVGRAGLEASAQLDDDELTALVRRELREVLDIAAAPEFVEIFRWPRGMPQYRVGHTDLVARIEQAVAGVPGVELAGGAYHGIGIGDCLREGAAAAERALEHVRGLPEDAVPPQPGDLPAADGVAD